MAKIESYLKRPTAILRMPHAIASGMSASKFLSSLKVQGLGYRRQTFLADWRSVKGIEARKDVFKNIRKDRRPSIKALADVEWDMNQEYMYKVRAHYRTDPEGPLEERFVNIPSDRNLSPREVEETVFERWDNWERYQDEVLDSVTVVAGYHRIEPLES